MNSRNKILNRLRQHQQPNLARNVSELQHPEPISTNWTTVQKIAHFKQVIEASHAEVYDVTEANWSDKWYQIAQEKHLKYWLYAPTTPTGEALEKSVKHHASEPRETDIELVAFEQNIEQLKDTLFNHIQASITTTRGAIAETGTLILWPTEEEPRTMSLVPPIHVALLKTSTIRGSFAETLESEKWAETGLPTNVLLISGPSKTADIQQTLAYGAHGPKELIVLLIHDSMVE